MEIVSKLSYIDFIEMSLLEQKFYSTDNITPADIAFDWYKKFPYTTIAAKDKNKIVGFINMFPISDYILKELRHGTFNDKFLTAEHIVDIHDPHINCFNMFLSCIVVEYEYRKSGLTKQLIQSAIEQYKIIEEKIDLIVIDNVTSEGNNFSQRYGFIAVCETSHNSLYHEQKYFNFCSVVKN